MDRQSDPSGSALGNRDLACISLSIRAIAITKSLLGFLQGLCLGELGVRPIAIFLEESSRWSELLDFLDDFAGESSFLRRREEFAIGSILHEADLVSKPLVSNTLGYGHASSVENIVVAQNDVRQWLSASSSWWHFEEIVVRYGLL